jgi:hypothetical protein
MTGGDEKPKQVRQRSEHDRQHDSADDVSAAPESGQPAGGREPPPAEASEDRARERRTPKGEDL